MPNSGRLRGFVGQAMRGQRANKRAQEPFTFPGGATYTFTPPVAGNWKFIAHASGGAGSTGVTSGGSGSYGEITRFLRPSEPVTLVVGNGADTIITFADGKVCTAGHTAAATPGTASGWDLSFSGSAGTSTGGGAGNPGLGPGGGVGGASGSGAGGAGAPGTLNYRGGMGGATGVSAGIGAGAGENGVPTLSVALATAVLIRA